MKSKNIFKFSVLAITIGVGFFYYKQNPEIYNEYIKNFYYTTLNYIKPCSKPIYYSFNQVDPGFNLSEKELKDISLKVEKIWEDPIGKNLLEYSEKSTLKINFIYDERQKTTNELANTSENIKIEQKKYDELKAAYDISIKEYENMKSKLDQSISIFTENQTAYNTKVELLNQSTKVTKEEIKEIENERLGLDNQLALLNKEKNEFNTFVAKINDDGNELNYLIKELNIKSAYYNKIGEGLKEEFQEGEYIRDANGERINIYEFNNKNKLIRVLTHELGHALGLEHNNDNTSIMYRLNEGENEFLSATDINDLKNLCKIK